MKRFQFTLQPLFQVKGTQKEKAEMEYAAALARVRETEEKRDGLVAERERGAQTHRRKLLCGITLPELQSFAAYFEDMQNAIETAERDIVRAKKIAERRQFDLVELFREMKLLEGLRKEQYRVYLKEENDKETRELENLLAYDAASGGEA